MSTEIDVDAIVDRIASGTLTRTIADELGIKKPTLRDKIKDHPRYADAIKDQAESLVEQATEEMMAKTLEADSAVIARARARVDTAHKWAAARDPATWGARQQQITINVLQADQALTGVAGELLGQLRTIGCGLSTDRSAAPALQHDNNEADSE